MPKLSSLSVFFPAYNEEANVENMVRLSQRILPEVAEKWEIIPVNDGSKDRTGEIIDRLAKEDPNVRPVHHEKNKGYGGAVISGYNASKYDYVFFTDGDLQFDLREITLLSRWMEPRVGRVGRRRFGGSATASSIVRSFSRQSWTFRGASRKRWLVTSNSPSLVNRAAYFCRNRRRIASGIEGEVRAGDADRLAVDLIDVLAARPSALRER